MNSSFKNTIPFLFGRSQLQKAIFGGQLSNSQQIFLENASEYFKMLLLSQLNQNQNNQQKFQKNDQNLTDKLSDSQISQSIEQIINQNKGYFYNNNDDLNQIDEGGYQTEGTKFSQKQMRILQSQKNMNSESIKSFQQNEFKQQKEQACQVSDFDKKQSRSSLKSLNKSNEFSQSKIKMQSRSQKSLKSQDQKQNNNFKNLEQMWNLINPNKDEQYGVQNLIKMQYQQAQMLMDLQQQLLKVKQLEEIHGDSLEKQSSKLINQESIEIMQSYGGHQDHHDSVYDSQSQKPPINNKQKQYQSEIDQNKSSISQKKVLKEKENYQQKKNEIKTPQVEKNETLVNQVISKRSDYSVKSKLSQTCLSNISQQKASTLSLIQKIYIQMEKIDQHIASKEKIDLERYSKMERRMSRLFQKYSKIKKQNDDIQLQAEHEASISQSISRSEQKQVKQNKNIQDKSVSQENKHSKNNSTQLSVVEEYKMSKSQISMNKKYRKEDLQKSQKDIENIDIAITGAESTLFSQNFIEMDLKNNFNYKKQRQEIEHLKSKHVTKRSSVTENQIQVQVLDQSRKSCQESKKEKKVDFNNQFPSLNQSLKYNQKFQDQRDQESEYGSQTTLQNEIPITTSQLQPSIKSNTYADLSQCDSIIEGKLKINPASDNSIVNYLKTNDFGDKHARKLHEQTQNIEQQLFKEQNRFQRQDFGKRTLQEEEQIYYLNEQQNKLNYNQIQQLMMQQQYAMMQEENYFHNIQRMKDQQENIIQNEYQNNNQPLTSNQIELENQVQQLNNAIDLLRNEHLNQIEQMKQFYAEQLKQIREEVQIAASAKIQKVEMSIKKQKKEDCSGTPANIPKTNTKSQENILNLTNLSMSASEQQYQRKIEVDPNLKSQEQQKRISTSQQENVSNKQAAEISHKIHLLEKQQQIIKQQVQISTNESYSNQKSVQKQSELSKFKEPNFNEQNVQIQAQEAIQKLMDQRKFTDTIEQLNQAVHQKEQLEQKLQRIKDKIQTAKSIKQKNGSKPDVYKYKNSNQSQSKSRYDQCGESADVRTSDIYNLIKQNDNEFSEDQTQSLISGSYRQCQMQVNPKTEKVTCRHNSSRNLLVIQNEPTHQQQKSFQTANPSPFNENINHQRDSNLDYSYINDQNISIIQDDKQLLTNQFTKEKEMMNEEQLKQNQTYQQQLNIKLDKTSVFSGDFGMGKNIQQSEHKNQCDSQSLEDIVNQQSVQQLMNYQNSNQNLNQQLSHQSVESKMMLVRSLDQAKQNEHDKFTFNQQLQPQMSAQNNLIQIDQKHNAYQQFVITNSSALGSTLLNQNSEKQSYQNANTSIQNNQFVQPFNEATFSNQSSVYLNSKNKVLTQSQQNISFQGAQNAFNIQSESKSNEKNFNVFNQQRSSQTNLNLQQINQNLKVTSLNAKFAKPFIPVQKVNGQPDVQPVSISYDNSLQQEEKILDIYLENTQNNNLVNSSNKGLMDNQKYIMNDNRRGVYQKIVDLQQQQQNNIQYRPSYLNGHNNTAVATVTSSSANIYPIQNNGSYQSSQNKTILNQDQVFNSSQSNDFRNITIQNQLNQRQNCNPLRKSPLRQTQAIGSGLGVKQNNSIGVPFSASVDFSLSQTNYGTIQEQDNQNYTEQQKQMSYAGKEHSQTIQYQSNLKSYQNNEIMKGQFDVNKYQEQQNINKSTNQNMYQNQQQIHVQNVQNIGNSYLFKPQNQFTQENIYNLKTQQNPNQVNYMQNIPQQFYQNQKQHQQQFNNNSLINRNTNYQQFEPAYKNQNYQQKFENVNQKMQYNQEDKKQLMNRSQPYENIYKRENYYQQSVQQKEGKGYKKEEIILNRTVDKSEFKNNLFSFQNTQNGNESRFNESMKDQTPKQLQVQQLHSENASYTLNSRTIEDDFTSSQVSNSKFTSDMLNSDQSLKY